MPSYSSQLARAARAPGSYTQSAFRPLDTRMDFDSRTGVGNRGPASAGGSGSGGFNLTERDFNLRTHWPKQTVTNAQGVSIAITPIKTVVFEDDDGNKVVLSYANAPLQKIVP